MNATITNVKPDHIEFDPDAQRIFLRVAFDLALDGQQAVPATATLEFGRPLVAGDITKLVAGAGQVLKDYGWL
jgi:hypothetical protein